jgi:glyoxylase-like metal-dependent hydrolase (beta-lactamase superfamily II)
MMPEDAHHWLSRIRNMTAEPIISLVQTDYDPGRVLSTHLVKAPVIAHEAAWERMLKLYSRSKAIQQIKDLLGSDVDWQVRMPDITFTKHMILNKGTHEIHILHGGGHSPATCMVHLPADRLIFTGDVVFSNAHPSMELAETGAWLSALTRLRKMEVDTIIPGHGPVCDRRATQPLSGYIREMRAQVRRSFGAGRSRSDTAKALIPEFLDAFPYQNDELETVLGQIKGGSDRIYGECRTVAKKRGKGKQRKKRKRRRRQAIPG